jgi:type VI protein secretion system component VasK
MLLAAIIVWAVAVGGCFIYAAVCGLRTFRRVRAAQATLEGRIAALQAEGVGQLEERTAELNEKMAAMQASLARLERSMAGLRVLTDSVSTASTVMLALRRVVRR